MGDIPDKFYHDTTSAGFNLDDINDDIQQGSTGDVDLSHPSRVAVVDELSDESMIDHRKTIRDPMQAMSVTLPHREIIDTVTEERGRVTHSLPDIAAPRMGATLMQREPVVIKTQTTERQTDGSIITTLISSGGPWYCHRIH